MDSFKRLTFCVLLALFCASPAFASGGGECDDAACLAMFSPRIIQNPAESPLFRTSQRLYPREASENINDVNVKEWSRYFNGALTNESLPELIYKMSRADLEALRSSVALERAPQEQSIRALSATFLRYGHRNDVLAALEYLDFAKRVEPLALKNQDGGWSDPPRERTPADINLPEMLAEANDGITRNSAFIADRYRFQAMRLMFYSEKYADAQQYYERFAGSFIGETSVKYRFMQLGAGAYYKEKRFGKANYIYSLVFDKFPALKASCYLSFHPMEDADWKETLSLAKNNREKAVLWQLLGIYVDGGAAIDNIYALDPQSTLLPLLLVREVNIAEEHWTAAQPYLHYLEKPSSKPIPGRDVLGAKRIDRIKAIADQGKAYKPYLWLMATGHLLALSGDRVQAEAYLRRAMSSMPNDPESRAQARASIVLARARALKSPDKNVEPFLANELVWLADYTKSDHEEASQLETWVLEHLSVIYKQSGDPVRSVMLSPWWSNEIYTSATGVDQILAFMPAPKTLFDRFLLRNYRHSIEQVREVRGVHFLYAGDLTRARDILKNTPAQNTAADPFEIHIKDCHDCDAVFPRKTYTRQEFIERLLVLSRVAQGNGQAAANASFELANGLYNMSYYGNSRSIYENTLGLFVGVDGPRNNFHPALNMDRAEKYYVQAANLSTDREFKAKATFMASKAEQNRSYNNGGIGNRGAAPGSHFVRLKDSYSDTQYYQEIIRECGYFRSFVER